jgi:hypothetical protein
MGFLSGIIVVACWVANYGSASAKAIAESCHAPHAASFRSNDAGDSSHVERGLPIPDFCKADMALRTPNFPTPADIDMERTCGH